MFRLNQMKRKGIIWLALLLLFTVADLLFLTTLTNTLLKEPSNEQGEVNSTNFTHLDDDLISKLFKDANVTLSTKEREMLPSWSSDRINLYGYEPKVVGMSTCSTFQQTVAPHDAILGIAGMFNTGTNLLSSLLTTYCNMPNGNKGFNDKYDVPWGKHAIANIREVMMDSLNQTESTLPVILIKDPFNWMQSIRKSSYFLSVRNIGPFLVWRNSTIKVSNGYLPLMEEAALRRKEITHKYRLKREHSASMIDYWKEWYDKYYNAKYPRLMIRYEDLIFHTEDTVTKICTCTGGTMNGTPKLPETSTKSHQGSSYEGNGLVGAIASTSDVDARLSKMTSEDIVYADKVLRGTEFLDVFGYSLSLRTDSTSIN